jgi:hypothetical protein
MTFPSVHRWPSELPALLLAGHVFSDVGVAEEAEFEQGEARARQIYTFNPQLVSVSTRLTQTQFDRFVAWFEDEIVAGAERFDVFVAEQGGGSDGAWWEAQFVGPPRMEAKSGRWIVSAELLLLDGPYATRTAPSLRGLATQTTQLIAQPVIDTGLRGLAVQSTELLGTLAAPSLRGLAEQTTELLAVSDDFFIAERGDDLLHSEGGSAFEPE